MQYHLTLTAPSFQPELSLILASVSKSNSATNL